MSDTPTQNPYLIQTNPVENRTVQFFKDSVQVGCFDFGVSPVTFTGDVDESARIFVDYVISKVQTELTAARQELKAVTEQRDELRKANEIISGREAEWIAKAHYDLDCMKEQRDRLADVLELFLNRVQYTSAFMDGELRGGKFDYRSSGFDAEVKQAYQTIAAVKGGNTN